MQYKLHERIFNDIPLPGNIGEMGLHPTKLEEMARSAVILQKDYVKTPRSRRNKQPIPPIMKNVRYQPNNPTETRTIPARTQIAAQNSELEMIDLHLNTATYIAPSPRQQICPAAADPPIGVRRGVGEG